jgi:hypothetical protein
MPRNVAPSESVELSIDLTAPPIEGRYKGVWILEDENGNRFGMGPSSTGEIWVQIQSVIAPTSVVTETSEPLPTQTSAPTIIPSSEPAIMQSFKKAPVKDLTSESCNATWTSNNGTLACPLLAEDTNAPAIINSSLAIEDGTTGNPAIGVVPGTANGFVTGIYPEYTVQPGDHFRALASCEANASGCSVLFRVRYQEGNNEIVDLWAAAEFFDGQYTPVDIDLSALAGKNIKLILDVKSLNSGITDKAVWVMPGIYRDALPTPTATLTPAATATVSIPTATVMVPTGTPVPLPTTQPSIWQSIEEFFRSLFGG